MVGSEEQGKGHMQWKIIILSCIFFPAPSENVILCQCIPPEHLPQHGTDYVCPLPNQTKSFVLHLVDIPCWLVQRGISFNENGLLDLY